MKWVKLTRPDGGAIWINPKQIVLVEAYKMEGKPSVNTAVEMISGARLYVNEIINELRI